MRLVGEHQSDTQRLDALQEHLWFVEPDYSDNTWRVGKADQAGRPQHKANSLRAAIDLAKRPATPRSTARAAKASP